MQYRWNLTFAPHYKWDKINRLINTKTGREIKKCVNGYSVGYYIKGRFYTIATLRKHIAKVEPVKCPF